MGIYENGIYLNRLIANTTCLDSPWLLLSLSEPKPLFGLVHLKNVDSSIGKYIRCRHRPWIISISIRHISLEQWHVRTLEQPDPTKQIYVVNEEWVSSNNSGTSRIFLQVSGEWQPWNSHMDILSSLVNPSIDTRRTSTRMRTLPGFTHPVRVHAATVTWRAQSWIRRRSSRELLWTQLCVIMHDTDCSGQWKYMAPNSGGLTRFCWIWGWYWRFYERFRRLPFHIA